MYSSLVPPTHSSGLEVLMKTNSCVPKGKCTPFAIGYTLIYHIYLKMRISSYFITQKMVVAVKSCIKSDTVHLSIFLKTEDCEER
jgi:hypothetical protein